MKNLPTADRFSTKILKDLKRNRNKLIAIDRLNKTQVLQMVNLVSLSNDINDLKDNLKWESTE